jgi:magnesium transporter
MELYFEDLEDKLEHIVNNIHILEEHIVSVEDSLITIINIKTNSTIKILTVFSAFMLPLTLITGFYGMNTEPLPLYPNNNIEYIF